MDLVDIEDGPLSLCPRHFKNQYKLHLVMSIKAVASRSLPTLPWECLVYSLYCDHQSILCAAYLFQINLVECKKLDREQSETNLVIISICRVLLSFETKILCFVTGFLGNPWGWELRNFTMCQSFLLQCWIQNKGFFMLPRRSPTEIDSNPHAGISLSWDSETAGSRVLFPGKRVLSSIECSRWG